MVLKRLRRDSGEALARFRVAGATLPIDELAELLDSPSSATQVNAAIEIRGRAAARREPSQFLWDMPSDESLLADHRLFLLDQRAFDIVRAATGHFPKEVRK
jgi:hypothetical protein